MIARARVAGRRYFPSVQALALECEVSNSHVLYRTKLPEWVIEKMIRKGKTLEEIPDYVGYAIVTRDLSQLALVTGRVPTLERAGLKVKKLEPRLHGPVVRAVHADLELDGVNGELQILPWWVKVGSDWDHDNIYKPPQAHKADLEALRAYSLAVLLWCFEVQHNPAPALPTRGGAPRALLAPRAGAKLQVLGVAMFYEYLIASDPRTRKKLEVREVTGFGEEELTDALVEVYDRYKGRVDLEIIGQAQPWGESPFFYDKSIGVTHPA